MSQQVNVEAQKKFTELINAGNVDDAVQVFAADCVDHDPAPTQGPGRAGFKNFFDALRTAFPDGHIEPAHLVADDDNVSVAYTLSGTHRGEFNGIAPTGKPIKIRGVQIARFADGRIVERWGSSDELGILEQIGVDPTGRVAR